MNQDEINKIQQVIDSHRKKAFVTCVETCPCWDIQSIIYKWKNRHKKTLASPSDNNDLIKDCLETLQSIRMENKLNDKQKEALAYAMKIVSNPIIKS